MYDLFLFQVSQIISWVRNSGEKKLKVSVKCHKLLSSQPKKRRNQSCSTHYNLKKNLDLQLKFNFYELSEDLQQLESKPRVYVRHM